MPMLSSETITLTAMQTRVMMHAVWTQSQLVSVFSITSEVYDYERPDGLPRSENGAHSALEALAAHGLIRLIPEAKYAGSPSYDCYLITAEGIQWRVDNVEALVRIHLRYQLSDRHDRAEARRNMKVIVGHYGQEYMRNAPVDDVEINFSPPEMEQDSEADGYFYYDDDTFAEELRLGFLTPEQVQAVAHALGCKIQ